MNITKDVIADLWPLYADGTASADTRTLVEAYVREHPEWSSKLQHATTASTLMSVPAVAPDREAQMLNRIKKRVRFIRILLFTAMMATAQAFGRIVADTTWTRSPRAFIFFCALAATFWIWWAVANWRVRRLGP